MSAGEVGIKFDAMPDGPAWIRMRACPLAGQWLMFYDPDARQGIGEAEFTSDVEDALRFPDFAAAEAFWSQQSTVAPVTALDGEQRENRPLQCVSITVAELP